jgi:mRNA-degrading endonuclease RelE of RelBE toxin-antitoxin system
VKLQVVEHPLYKKSIKDLSKHYRSTKDDVNDFLESVENLEGFGVELKKHLYKSRIKNSDNNKGKSGGYRLISFALVTKEQIHLLYIYDKSRLKNVTEKEIDGIILKQIEGIE